MNKVSEQALIIDFGSQFTRLIARRLRESGIYCEIHSFAVVDELFLREFAPAAIILSGGPARFADASAPRLSASILEYGVPILGICYGQQALIAANGGTVEAGQSGEFGRAMLHPSEPESGSALLAGWFSEGKGEQVWMSHGDHVGVLPSGFTAIAGSDGAPFAVAADESRRFYGVQFHPEVSHTPKGARLLRNFTHDIAGMRGDWNMSSFRTGAIASIREQVGAGSVICGLSGGVDSAVASVLIHEAIGEKLTCIFVDTGLLRAGEAEQVVSLFGDSFDIKLVHVQAQEQFLAVLRGVTDPEQKRKNIGKCFIEIFESEAKKLGGADFLAQGTLYPDVIESACSQAGPSSVIKSHHNVGGLPERMQLRLLEPLRELFKDEARKLGRELGLPEAFIGRHPFPGPGLAIRIPGEVTASGLDILRRADTIFLDEIRRAGLYDQIWQAFAVLLPVRSVGVMGDERSYEHVLSLRAVNSTDGMTADTYPFSSELLSKISTRLVGEVRGVNRVLYDITSKPPGTIEWE